MDIFTKTKLPSIHARFVALVLFLTVAKPYPLLPVLYIEKFQPLIRIFYQQVKHEK